MMEHEWTNNQSIYRKEEGHEVWMKENLGHRKIGYLKLKSPEEIEDFEKSLYMRYDEKHTG